MMVVEKVPNLTEYIKNVFFLNIISFSFFVYENRQALYYYHLLLSNYRPPSLETRNNHCDVRPQLVRPYLNSAAQYFITVNEGADFRVEPCLIFLQM